MRTLQGILDNPRRRCRPCGVGSIEELCWICGEPMLTGEVGLLIFCPRDAMMLDVETRWAPAVKDDLKNLKG